MATIKNIEKERKFLKGRLVSTQTVVNNIDPARVTSHELEFIIHELKDHLDATNDLAKRTIILCEDDDEYQPHEVYYESFFNAIRVLQLKAMAIQTARKTSTHQQAAPAFKLEKIKLPQFGGNFADWRSFHDLFEASVDKNPTLSGAEKLIHLKSCLTGDASNIVSSFQATAADYIEAWETVKARYDNKREIIFAHIKKFDDSKSMTVESGTGLRVLADIMNECFRSLKVLGVPVDHWDLILIYLATKKLDLETKKQWSLNRTTALPTFKEFISFLESRSLALMDSSLATKSKSQPNQQEEKKKATAHHSSKDQKPRTTSNKSPCPKCTEDHALFMCPVFKSLPGVEKQEFVSKNSLCFRCLRRGHSASSCPEKRFACKACKHHHFLLPCPGSGSSQRSAHVSEVEVEKPASTQQAVDLSTSSSSSHCIPEQRANHVLLLGTLVVTTDDSKAEKQNCRVFVDPGSEPNFISEGCISRLGLKRKPTCVNISGVGGGAGLTATGMVNIRLHSKVRPFWLDISALILPRVTGMMPRSTFMANWPHLEKLELGDPSFNQSGHIDILLGCDAASNIKIPGLIRGSHGAPTAENTEFGWLLTGLAGHSTPTLSYHATSFHASCSEDKECLEESLQKFWRLEETDRDDHSTCDEDEQCEDHFVSTYQRGVDGRYTVQLPFKKDAPALGCSRSTAIKRFRSVEARLSFQPDLKESYTQSMRESIQAGFMERIPSDEIYKDPEESFYLPHHAVVKQSSSSTKCRIVFDASTRTSTGVSLNDVLMTGPKLQVDLVPLLIRFRSHRVAMSADIHKFYPQFRVSTKDADFQRLVWRESPDLTLEDFRMVRVTFGITCAPFQAIRCLHQLAFDERAEFPLAHQVIKRDFLVDNLLSGANDEESALQLQSQLLQVMDRGRMQLRKWSSNKASLLGPIPLELRDSQSSLQIDETETLRTIGILWQPGPDKFGISIVTPDVSTASTKRKVLSSIARIFDPLGWLSPVTIRPKILMQEMWMEKLDWDSELPPHLHKQWISYCLELDQLRTFTIDRCMLLPPSTIPVSWYELHGYCDASSAAYSACIYIRTVDELGNSRINLVTAKTKVAPVKVETIPRLELCGALLLSKLVKSVQAALAVRFQVIRCWTDAQVVLDWLHSSAKLPVFVANRVRKIEAVLPRTYWLHIKGEENPADCASRGISAAALIHHPLWLSGPPSLSMQQFAPNAEVKSMAAFTYQPGPITTFICKCSSFSRMKRVIAYCIRFVTNSRIRKEMRQIANLTTMELRSSLIKIVHCVQSMSFKEDIIRLRRQDTVKTPLKFLNPFLDEDGLLRVGGRLNLAEIPQMKKHPMLLPQRHNFTDQMTRFLHITHQHAGPQLLLALIREQFWIIRGQDVVKRIVRSCVTCHRNNPVPLSQIMAPLPFSRVTPSRPFSQCGVDYAGPFKLSSRAGRHPVLIKAYVSLFVCMATKAIHLELVSDLSTPAFIAALTRLVSRRGLPADIYCDGGLNFQGARNEIENFLKLVQSPVHNTAVSEFLAEKGVIYHFNPPYGPHHGGLWEAGVKSMKHHLRRIMEDRRLSLEEFSTLLTQVEATLNSRPLTQMSHDPNDFSVLTPAHFLIGDSLSSLPQQDLTHLKMSRLSRWQAMQQMSQHFWKRWSSEYLSLLQSRSKWLSGQVDIQVGTLVLIRDDTAQWGLQKWKLARINAVFPGPDGKVRVVEVKTATGSTYRRPIVKVSPLPIYV